MPDVPRCLTCGKTTEDIARLYPGRIPTVGRGPGSTKHQCNLCWLRTPPAVPRTDRKSRP